MVQKLRKEVNFMSNFLDFPNSKVIGTDITSLDVGD